MEVFTGRPANGSGRDEVELRCYDLLDQLGIEYIRTDHAPADTMEICKDIDAVLDCLICKNLFLCNRQQTVFYLLLMPGDKPFKTKELSAQLGVSRLSFGNAQFMEEFLSLQPGSVSLLGLMNDKDKRVRLIIDADVLKEEYFACHPCRNTSSIRFSTRDLNEKLIPSLEHEPTVVHLIGEDTQ